MAHWAEVDSNNKVLRVLVTDNNDPNGDEGYQWLVENLGGHWIKTSYNSNIRKNFAGIDYIYDETKDAFIAPQPYPSWILDENSCRWQAPVFYPLDDNRYWWDEDTKQWVKVHIDNGE